MAQSNFQNIKQTNKKQTKNKQKANKQANYKFPLLLSLTQWLRRFG
jgi:hypothetical protein